MNLTVFEEDGCVYTDTIFDYYLFFRSYRS